MRESSGATEYRRMKEHSRVRENWRMATPAQKNTAR